MKTNNNKIKQVIGAIVNGFSKGVQKQLAPKTDPVVAGIWSEEQNFLSAIRGLKQKGHKNILAITPAPVHGLEELLEIKRSWIPYVTFAFGAFGCLFGLWFTWWTSAVDWPLIVGGKPLWSLPAFIPVIFECVILLGALSSVVALFFACKIPCFNPPVLDESLSSHKFAIYFKLKDKKVVTSVLEEQMRALGAEKVIQSDF